MGTLAIQIMNIIVGNPDYYGGNAGIVRTSAHR